MGQARASTRFGRGRPAPTGRRRCRACTPSLVDQPGKTTWPITGASFILVQKDQEDAARAKSMLDYFDWCFAERRRRRPEPRLRAASRERLRPRRGRGLERRSPPAARPSGSSEAARRPGTGRDGNVSTVDVDLQRAARAGDGAGPRDARRRAVARALGDPLFRGLATGRRRRRRARHVRAGGRPRLRLVAGDHRARHRARSPPWPGRRPTASTAPSRRSPAPSSRTAGRDGHRRAARAGHRAAARRARAPGGGARRRARPSRCWPPSRASSSAWSASSSSCRSCRTPGAVAR